MSKINEQSYHNSHHDTCTNQRAPYSATYSSQQQKTNDNSAEESVSINEINHEYTSPLGALEAKRAVPQHAQSKIPQYAQSKKEIPDNRRPPPVKIDPSLPPEIAALFKTNVCDLCEVKLNSRIQAKSHYDGKQHARKLKMKIEGQVEKEPEASSDTNLRTECLSPPPSKKKKSSENKSQLYCKCCDLSFTSTDHATQHYLGRNHHRVLHGLKPLKAGYYNKETGKWQRMPPDPRTPTEQLSGSEDSNSGTYKPKGRFFCELCSIAATSQEQLDGHQKGQKHQKAQQRASTSDAVSALKTQD